MLLRCDFAVSFSLASVFVESWVPKATTSCVLFKCLMLCTGHTYVRLAVSYVFNEAGFMYVQNIYSLPFVSLLARCDWEILFFATDDNWTG